MVVHLALNHHMCDLTLGLQGGKQHLSSISEDLGGPRAPPSGGPRAYSCLENPMEGGAW